MESKKEIYDLIPQKYYPSTLLISPTQPIATVLEECMKKNITFPFIAKPDVGLRGTAVKK